MPEVSVVIVCMNRPDILYPCLDSICEHTSVSCEVWVVAYLFSPENLTELRTNYPNIHVVESNELRGFSENNNLALRQVQSRYCFVVNDDTLMTEPVIDRLVADMENLPSNAAAISPCVRFSDGRIQTCGRAPWTPWRYAKHYLHLVDETKPGRWNAAERLATFFAKKSADAPKVVRPFQTFTLNGACFLIKTEAFKKMGWFDERYFFTPEDIALGHALNESGYSVWADPSVNITHLAGGSVSAMEGAIKPARVRGSLIFYGEPLWLKCFIWCVEAARYLLLGRVAARNVMRAVFSKESPKEIFIRFKP